MDPDISTIPKARHCNVNRCNRWLPSPKSDPHFTCLSCRKFLCTIDGPKCNFCKSWSRDFWLQLIPVPKRHADKNPLNRNKRKSRAKSGPISASPTSSCSSTKSRISISSLFASSPEDELPFLGFVTDVKGMDSKPRPNPVKPRKKKLKLSPGAVGNLGGGLLQLPNPTRSWGASAA